MLQGPGGIAEIPSPDPAVFDDGWTMLRRSEAVETYIRLHPAPAVRWYDTAAAVERILRILDDGPCCASVVEHASRAVEFYSVKHCRTWLRAMSLLRWPGAAPC